MGLYNFAKSGSCNGLCETYSSFYLKLNNLAKNSLLRIFLRLIGQPELALYYREYYKTVKEGLEEFDGSGIDRLFHGAPAAIVVGCKANATLPKEDALLAAHSMGLATCLIGMAVKTMKRDGKIQNSIGIPTD